MFFNKLIPSHILSNLYTRGSLRATEQGVTFSLKNRLMNVSITQVLEASVNGKAIDLAKVRLVQGAQAPFRPDTISEQQPLSAGESIAGIYRGFIVPGKGRGCGFPDPAADQNLWRA